MMKINETSEMLDRAHFSCEVENPLPGLPISFLSVKVSKDAGPVTKMLAKAMGQSPTVASTLMMAVAEYHLEENVDVLRIIYETIEELKKMREAAKHAALFPNQKNPVK